jgi:hypothetical protein
MLLMAFPAIHTPASCHTPLPAWLQSPLLAPSGPRRSLERSPLSVSLRTLGSIPQL